MFNGKYVIGICLNKIYEIHTRRYMEALYERVQGENIRLVVYHSLNDYFYDISGNEGAASVYALINYRIVDALVVLPETFKNRKIVDRIIKSAREADKPVISVDRELNVDVCIMPDQERIFDEIVRHLITVHRIKRPYFLGGYRNEEDSKKRENAYCRILKEYDIPLEKNFYMDYGEYWSEPTNRAMDRLFASGVKLPDAIICANDSMAFAVCEYLSRMNISVPEDIIVTGYDGIDPEDMMVPSITTCENDYETYADHTIDSAMRLIDGAKSYSLWHVPLRIKLAESCGCRKKNFSRYANLAGKMYEMVSQINHVDSHWFGMVNQFVDETNVLNMRRLLLNYMPSRSAVCFNDNFVNKEVDSAIVGDRTSAFTEKMTALAAKGYGDRALDIVSVDSTADVLPRYDNFEWKDVTIFTSIYSENKVYGFFAMDVNEFRESSRLLHRFASSLGISVGLSDRTLKNESLKNELSMLSVTDAVTGLPNFRGLRKQLLELYENDPKRTSKRLVVSIYAIRNWIELMNELGMEEAEKSLLYVRDSLQNANGGDYLLGRYMDGRLILINVFDPEIDISPEINERVSSFYSQMNAFNDEHSEKYYLEVNAGCTIATPGWEGTLDDLVRIASNELIVNRLRSGNDSQDPAKERILTTEMLDKFNRLLDENLFFYNFQPIVDAKTGDIYAFEALMRTPKEIGLFPDMILEIAEKTGRLYDIEKATMFNVLNEYHKRREEFKNRRVFINTIPGCMLTDSDFALLDEKHGGDTERIVIEITEQFYGTDEQMEHFINRIGGKKWRYAIDDYGTGNSNIVNLLKFDPHLIKIDRYLITGIENDVNKQMFVKNIIEFARNNNMKVIAEGVETLEELESVIGFGVDLIQGYYTARPGAEIPEAIAEEIRNKIISARPQLEK